MKQRLSRFLFLKTLIFGAVFLLGLTISSFWAKAQEFFVESSYQPQTLSKLPASQRYESQKAYFYVEDAWYLGLNSQDRQQVLDILTNLGREFDNVIYPKETNVFGSEWSPGIDGDPKITILFTQMISMPGGYFNPIDELLKAQASNSNQREMIYLNSLYLKDSKLNAFLAHEFQHLITYNQKNRLRGVDDEVWLNEARSEYASTLCGYNNVYDNSNLARRVETFLAQPSDPLTHWQNDVYDYGAVSMFAHYLTGRFGEKILTQMMQTNKTGIGSIDWALESLGYVERFADIFSDWSIANLINNCYVGEGERYCYINPNLTFDRLHIQFSTNNGSAVSAISFDRNIANWAINWQRFTAKVRPEAKYLSIKFTGQTNADFKVYYIATDNQGRQQVNILSLITGQGVIYFNNFGSYVSQIDLAISWQPNTIVSNTLDWQSFNLSVATHDGRYGPLRDNTLALASDGKVYLIRDGQKQWITSALIFESRYQWSAVKKVTDEDLLSYQDGSPIKNMADGILVKSLSQDRVYVIAGGWWHWLTSAAVFSGLGYQWNKIIIVSDSDLAYHSLGVPITSANLHPEGSLIKGSSATVYLVQNNYKRPIQSLSVFEANNFKWDRLIVVSDAELVQYNNGPMII